MKWWIPLAAAALTSGCGSFSRPPLPKFATGVAPPPTHAEEAEAATLRHADVIYFGVTTRRAAESEPAWRIIATLQGSGARVALGWSELSSAQQPLLDQWQRQEISAQQLVDQLGAPKRSDWMQHALRPGLVQLALGAPRELLRKIRAGDSLTDEERALLPNDYRPRPDAFDTFADRVSSSPHLRRYNLARLYRAHLAAEEIIAENIVRFIHDNPGVKLLVFLPDDAMIDPREVANFAAQKASLQQLILDRSQRSPGARSQLLARRGRGAIQVVDRAPEPARHDRRFPTPRLRT